jgi:hypothetical protein
VLEVVAHLFLMSAIVLLFGKRAYPKGWKKKKYVISGKKAVFSSFNISRIMIHSTAKEQQQ